METITMILISSLLTYASLVWLWKHFPDVLSGLITGAFLMPALIMAYQGQSELALFLSFMIVSIWYIRNPEYTTRKKEQSDIEMPSKPDPPYFRYFKKHKGFKWYISKNQLVNMLKVNHKRFSIMEGV